MKVNEYKQMNLSMAFKKLEESQWKLAAFAEQRATDACKITELKQRIAELEEERKQMCIALAIDDCPSENLMDAVKAHQRELTAWIGRASILEVEIRDIEQEIYET